jgi:DtxR family manganese transport transcriptional regulator
MLRDKSPPTLPREKRTKAPAKGYVRARADHQTEVAEDYVELIDDLRVEMGEARAVDISKRLGVSHVTVSKTLTRLQEAGLVQTRPYRSIFLTDEGKLLAERCHQRHQIVLDCLVALGVPFDVASVDAEGIEHHVSGTTMEAMHRFTK